MRPLLIIMASCVLPCVAGRTPAPAAAQVRPVAEQCPEPGPGQAHLAGGVHDLLTRVPLQRAEVMLSWTSQERGQTVMTTTDRSGRFTACLLPAGELIMIRAEFDGRTSSPESRRLAAGQRVYVDVQVPAPHSSINGQTRAGVSGEGVGAVAVRVAGTRLTTTTARDGRFRFPRIPAGEYILEFDHVAFAQRSDTVRVRRAADTYVTVPMAATAIALDPIHVATRMHRLEQAGFYRRADRGVGHFVTPDEVDRARPTLTTDLLRFSPGTTLALRSGGAGYDVLGRGRCRYGLVVDGIPSPDGDPNGIPAIWVQALEVYPSRSAAPPQYRSHATPCGVILLWTRTELPRRR